MAEEAEVHVEQGTLCRDSEYLEAVPNSVVQHLLLMQRKHCEVGARFHDSEECRCWKVTI